MDEECRRKLVDEASQAAYAQLIQNFKGGYQREIAQFEAERKPPRTYADLPKHVRDWLETKNADDLAEIDEARKLIDRLPAGTRDWLKDKRDEDLQNIDRAVDFISSSRFAGKVLMYVGGLSITIVSGAWAVAKFGWDIAHTFKVIPR